MRRPADAGFGLVSEAATLLPSLLNDGWKPFHHALLEFGASEVLVKLIEPLLVFFALTTISQ